MASGLPVLGVDSAGTSDTVNQGITGFLSENQIESFVEKMEKLIVDRELRLQMGKNALQESAKYRIENSVEQLLNVYLQAIEFHKVR
jgi:glycosyltransferase involved in cell wall biosynthesis